MIRGVVVHLNNEQPIVVDLWETPKPGDAGMVCTNVRTPDGKRPSFVDREDSTFFFPYRFIRFIEIHPDAEDVPSLPEGAISTTRDREAQEAAAPAAPEEDLEIDEDFLRRIREV